MPVTVMVGQLLEESSPLFKSLQSNRCRCGHLNIYRCHHAGKEWLDDRDCSNDGSCNYQKSLISKFFLM